MLSSFDRLLNLGIGGDKIENLRVICIECNRSMGNTHMIEYLEKHKELEAFNRLELSLELRQFNREHGRKR